jgi:aspartate aminotransferase-like enzyme
MARLAGEQGRQIFQMAKRNPIVMIPGPTPVARSIQDAMGRETIAYNDPRFVADFKALIGDLMSMWKCDGLAFVVPGSGTMAMEMGLANIAEAGERALVCANGYFGERFVDICERKGFVTDALRPPKCGQSVTVDEIDAKLSENRYDLLVVTHIETSTGVLFPLRELARMMRERHPDVLLLVDGVASMGGVEFSMDWGIDVTLTCSQKCFGMSPGLGIVWASARALAKRESMRTIRETYVDFEKWVPVMREPDKYWGTPSVNMIWALCESVRIIKEEGLEARQNRHLLFAKAVRESVKAMGFEIGTAPELVAPTVTAALYPEGCALAARDEEFRKKVYDEGANIAGCLGGFAGRGFRIGHMGNIDEGILAQLIASVERGCIKCGHDLEPGVGLAAMQRVLLGKQ